MLNYNSCKLMSKLVYTNNTQFHNNKLNFTGEDKPAGMKVLYAYYGVTCARGNHMKANQDRSTDWAAGICDGKISCSGTVLTSVLTDPYRGCAKDLVVVAQCADGRVIADLVPRPSQGKDFSLSCC